MRQTLLLHPHRGERIAVQAIVRRTAAGPRVLRSAGIVGVGAVLGALAIVIPPHGLWTLACWALSSGLGWLFWSRTVVIETLEGTCSTCRAPFAVQAVGAWSQDLWVRCPACQAPYRVGEPAA